MALGQVLRALRRHVVIVLIGVLATVGAAVVVHSQQGLYQSRAGVMLVPPKATAGPNPFYGREYSVIATAGVIAKIVNGDGGGAETVSSSVTLAGQGVTEGYAARLFDGGNQWANDYDRPILEVQAVSRTPEGVATLLGLASEDLQAALDYLQDQSAVPPERRMTLELVPGEPQTRLTQGRPGVALVATLLAGFGATLAAAGVTDGVLLRVRRRRARPPAPRRPGDPGAASGVDPGGTPELPTVRVVAAAR